MMQVPVKFISVTSTNNGLYAVDTRGQLWHKDIGWDVWVELDHPTVEVENDKDKYYTDR